MNTKSTVDYTFRHGGVVLTVPKSEPHTFYATYLANEWGLLRLRPGDAVLDAGANVGDFAILASQRVGPSGRVVAVEPSPVALKYLQRNLISNNARNVIVADVMLSGVGESTRVKRMGTYVVRASYDDPTSERMRTSTIDELLNGLSIDHIDVVKMDIEGAEASALRGAKFLERVRELCVETHSATLERQVLDILEEQGFQLQTYSRRNLYRSLLSNLVFHLPSFLGAELQTGGYATRRTLPAMVGRPEVPALSKRSEVRIYYARRGVSS
jgi:FkbM family methyltransferase